MASNIYAIVPISYKWLWAFFWFTHRQKHTKFASFILLDNTVCTATTISNVIVLPHHTTSHCHCTFTTVTMLLLSSWFVCFVVEAVPQAGTLSLLHLHVRWGVFPWSTRVFPPWGVVKMKQRKKSVGRTYDGKRTMFVCVIHTLFHAFGSHFSAWRSGERGENQRGVHTCVGERRAFALGGACSGVQVAFSSLMEWWEREKKDRLGTHLLPPSVRLPAFVCPFRLPLQGWGGAMRKISKEKKKDGVATYLHRVSVVIVVAQEPVVVFALHQNAS